MVHESSHMDQFLENCEEWSDYLGLELTELWLSGNPVPRQSLQQEIESSINLELDCEKRTVKKIIKYKLDTIIDVTRYIQMSNAYIFFYLWMKARRRWYKIDKEPYKISDIVSEMPKTFDVDYSTLDAKYLKLFDKFL